MTPGQFFRWWNVQHKKKSKDHIKNMIKKWGKHN